MEVHRKLGNGFLEPVYQEALARELSHQHIPYLREHQLRMSYMGRLLEKCYLVDFICFDNIIVEIKTNSELTSEYCSQQLNCMKANNFNLGILINFGNRSSQKQTPGQPTFLLTCHPRSSRAPRSR